ncbi:MAG TPA: hypothetical protein VJ276_20990 [Thermoanaerobaculia bacterium]|nr:hypothetical protein [Thermoanaerobaculia bacterium]
MYADLLRRVPTAERLRTTDPEARLIEAGEIAQALIDEEFRRNGFDALTPLHRAALSFARGHECELALPDVIESKVPEGYAFYAVYPALYERAARSLPKAERNVVIGIRSIGTSLGAVVANAVDADLFITVRPVGHPFQRELALREDIIDRGARYLIVDEGPGLSGSSFGCVADYLEDHGVDQIVMMPSHAGSPGPQASARHLERWRSVQRPVADFDAFFCDTILPEIAQLAGPVDGEPRDLGAGAWRTFVKGADEVPVWKNRERRKYLLDGKWLAKFAGIGPYGAAKLEKARRLTTIPHVLGLVRGFLIEQWIDGARIADRASLREPVRRHLEQLRGLDSDNRMHPWEWIEAPDGRILKCDALDHSLAHDGLGARGSEWDTAGAVVELGLDYDVDVREYAAAQEQIFRQGARESDAEEARRLNRRADYYASFT